MGMAVGGRRVSLEMAMTVASISTLTREYLLEREEFEEAIHGSEENLKVIKNDKVKGKHKKPFYVKNRW